MSASSFRIAFRVLAPERRRAIEAVYGFCRAADDAVDEARDRDHASRQLAAIRTALEETFAGEGPWPALREAIARFRLPRTPFDDLLEGVGWDLEGRRYATRQDLREYARRVASTVGLLCVRVFGCERGRCDGWAEELGIALQWTNVLRDVGVDLDRGRVYLPEDSLREHGVDEPLLRRARAGAATAGELRRVDGLIRAEAAHARACFARAAAVLPDAERARVLSGRIMGAVYRALLERIVRQGAGVLRQPPHITALSRTAIAARVVLTSR